MIPIGALVKASVRSSVTPRPALLPRCPMLTVVETGLISERQEMVGVLPYLLVPTEWDGRLNGSKQAWRGKGQRV